MYPPGPETVTTYRYVRLSIIGVVVLLFAALAVAIARDDWAVGPSISAYYYGPVRSVLVGSLVAAAFLLVAVRGRPGLEDALLNLGGMVLPVVAFIPTPVVSGDCLDASPCVPSSVVPDVEVSISALLLLGLPGLAVAALAVLARRAGRSPNPLPSGFVGAVVVWAVVAVWFGPTSDWPLRPSLFELGHYVAAVVLFAMIVAVVAINARRTDRAADVAGRSLSFTMVYIIIAVAMAAVLVAAVLVWWTGQPAGSSLLFWVEAALLSLFAIFWAVQTVEYWNAGLPEEACA